MARGNKNAISPFEIFAPISWESDKKKKELRNKFNQEIYSLIIDCLKNYEVKNGLK